MKDFAQLVVDRRSQHQSPGSSAGDSWTAIDKHCPACREINPPEVTRDPCTTCPLEPYRQGQRAADSRRYPDEEYPAADDAIRWYCEECRWPEPVGECARTACPLYPWRSDHQWADK